VAWGNCVELAEQAAKILDADGVALVEVIDLRTLSPCDWDSVAKSLAKTGRLVVVQEDARTGGFGQTVLAEMVSQDERFFSLSSPPYLVSRPDVQVPFCPHLELGILPSVKDVVEAVRKSLS
jgi:pyruvate/2-oxoglutarate/acetoin dehydrogenase E1 component